MNYRILIMVQPLGTVIILKIQGLSMQMELQLLLVRFHVLLGVLTYVLMKLRMVAKLFLIIISAAAGKVFNETCSTTGTMSM